ncbi:type VI secretion system protein VasJ [Pseudoalteromonas citrea]|uniref:Type VI secretion system protein VasJ n=2 Tax=Pseudoalteromonas citrea TaxID=43655 RepID=A0AAD4FRC4_9GAMM|nr:TssA family type VI secretion system protein [Pseudoalteromonas citrea]KAF7769675.1 type VI secretion system protein VasJ [Pseudoalteromonas citrea]
MSVPHTHESWALWHDALITPLINNACGEDLKYEDSFKALKSSSSGVGEVDFKALFILGTDLLATKTKDLRVMSYTCLAASSEYGVEGLIASLSVFNSLVNEFTAHIHPLKPRARGSVHTWFLQQQGRLRGIIEQHKQPTAQQWHALNIQVNEYGQSSARQLDEEAGPLADLTQWIEQGCKSNPLVIESPAEAMSSQGTQDIASPAQIEPTQQGAGVVKNIDSDSVFIAQTRVLISYDKEAKRYERMVKMARATRWSGLKLPPNEQGKTRLPAPRTAAFAPIENALMNADHEQGLIKAEALFMEGAMHFNLNLQVLTIELLRKLGLGNLERWLSVQVLALINECAGLLSLTYDDGTPFCSAKSKTVLDEIKESITPQASSAVKAPDEDIQKSAFSLADDAKLHQALQRVDELPQNCAYSKARADLLKARVLMRADNPVLAKPLFLKLIDQVETQQLAAWHRDFAMHVWRYAQQCFVALPEQDDEFKQLAESLTQKMLITNTTSAIGWI